MQLTDRLIRSLKADAKDRFHADSDGLYLRVSTTGRKTFVHRSQGKSGSRWVTIGAYPDTSLSDARVKSERLKTNSGIKNFTVESAYAIYHKRILSKRQRPDISAARFNADILPAVGDELVVNLDRRKCLDIVDKVVSRGSPVMANRVLSDLKQFAAFCVERGYIERSPLDGVTRRAAGGREVPRSRTLSWDELSAFLTLLKQELVGKRGLGVGTAAALYLCVLTGQRASEVLSIMRGHVSNQRAARLQTTKSMRPHVVHLSIQARAVLGAPPPKDHRVLSHALRRLGASFTPHDLRRTFASRMADLGVAPHVIEKILNHKLEGMMAVYNHAEYMPEREAAMKLWGLKVAALRRKKSPALGGG